MHFFFSVHVQFHWCLVCMCLSLALSTLKLCAFQHHLSLSPSYFTSPMTSNATYLSLCHHQLSTNSNSTSDHPLPREQSQLLLHFVSTYMYNNLFYAEPSTTCCVGFLYIRTSTCSFVEHAALCFNINFSYKTHDCVHLLYRAYGSSTTTSGVTPARP